MPHQTFLRLVERRDEFAVLSRHCVEQQLAHLLDDVIDEDGVDLPIVQDNELVATMSAHADADAAILIDRSVLVRVLKNSVVEVIRAAGASKEGTAVVDRSVDALEQLIESASDRRGQDTIYAAYDRHCLQSERMVA
jgi:hypothetical protein